MRENYKDSWTILIYADGNNEMEDIMLNTFKQCESIGIIENINVIMEIGLLGSNSSKGSWKGVRRYYIDSSVPVLLEDFKMHNMADPNNLYKFIIYGINNYPAKHYMIILSGHGTDFVGCLTDSSMTNNYIMGIPEMFKAVYLASKNSSSIIDVLCLDMCFMNSVEILYEASQYEDFIKRMMVYTNYAPYDGLDYKSLIKLIYENYINDDMNLFVKYLIKNFSFDLTAYELNKDILTYTKNLFSDLAKVYLTSKNSNQHPFNVLENLNNTTTIPSSIQEINDKLQSIIIYSKPEIVQKHPFIKITCDDIGGLIQFYSKLAFSKDNYWTRLLSNLPAVQYESHINKVKVRTTNSSFSSEHYMLELKP